jgi:hypothetical protein
VRSLGFGVLNAATIWIAAGLLGVLEASINISMELFRAVADRLPQDQRTRGFATQSLFIGLGAVIASSLPWVPAGRLEDTSASALRRRRVFLLHWSSRVLLRGRRGCREHSRMAARRPRSLS